MLLLGAEEGINSGGSGWSEDISTPMASAQMGAKIAQSRNIRSHGCRDLIQVLLLFLSLLHCQQLFGSTFLRIHPTAGKGGRKSRPLRWKISTASKHGHTISFDGSYCLKPSISCSNPSAQLYMLQKLGSHISGT